MQVMDVELGLEKQHIRKSIIEFIDIASIGFNNSSRHFYVERIIGRCYIEVYNEVMGAGRET